MPSSFAANDGGNTTTKTAHSISHSPPSVWAARRVCEEARQVLVSLRGGPPHVARGDLAADLVELRDRLPSLLEANMNASNIENKNIAEISESNVDHTNEDIKCSNGDSNIPNHNENTTPTNDFDLDVALPFLQVITDPRASGPHTLVALRSVRQLLVTGALWEFPGVRMAEILRACLHCKFEQTDAGADEAVELAIAQVLAHVVQLDVRNIMSNNQNSIIPMELVLEAFQVVFDTRHAVAHSPPLTLLLQDLLIETVQTVSRRMMACRKQPADPVPRILLEFIVHQLLHTPLVGGDGMDESTREAQRSHNATRVLCLRLVRAALEAMSWDDHDAATTTTDDDPDNGEDDDDHDDEHKQILELVQDDLCLSLLMTGQAIWAYHDEHNSISPGFVSIQVLSEICATLSLLWNTVPLRNQLIPQFETIWTGFYTRALVLLRKRHPSSNSVSFNANLIFDAEVEIILESLVDILCLHRGTTTIAQGDGGALATIFCQYDCHLHRSDVAVGLLVELCRCCGGVVDTDGESIVLTPTTSTTLLSSTGSVVAANVSDAASQTSGASNMVDGPMVQVDHVWRTVPPHLKELCAQAIMGAMKCLFRDDQASAETLLERSRRKRSIMSRQVSAVDDNGGNGLDDLNHAAVSDAGLRRLKSKKRLMRKAAKIFNTKASRGIEFLVDAGLVADPVTPLAVARFLRNGIVVGLDKKEVGAYLGEAGKAPMAGKSPPSWERDWFHKEVLQSYCGLFRFEDQSLLDGLRMFLAAFRLPGEAQQIDRILQAFSDTCSRVCEERADRMGIFSTDPKRASDAAYLLSFSIIMLNTDRHNDNIREDRKMSAEAFYKNNFDYGRDITEKGKEFPREFLDSIYDSINEEEIRTEGEGADGAMTVERWKDVLRGSSADDQATVSLLPSLHDAEDLTELVLEHVWKPIMGSIGAFWGISRQEDDLGGPASPTDQSQSGMLGVQGARLGMDMAVEMLKGVRQLGRVDIFRKIFNWICEYSGLLGDYTVDAVERTWSLTNSVEAQSAVVVAIRTALDSGEDLDEDGWKRIWSILFEMRDLKLLAHGLNTHTLLQESDPDLLNEDLRRDWTTCLVKGDMDYHNRPKKLAGSRSTGMLGAFGRALFGTEDDIESDEADAEARVAVVPSTHGKEDLVVWDDSAPSDDEEEEGGALEDAEDDSAVTDSMTPGAEFENMLIQESVAMNRLMAMPVTGLERADEIRRYHLSPRARVRSRFRKSCNFEGLVSESRFLDDPGICALLRALVDLVAKMDRSGAPPLPPKSAEQLTRSPSSDSIATPVFAPTSGALPISPASEAFAEVLLCEITLKNRDRLKMLWETVLQDHYIGSLTRVLVNPNGDSKAKPVSLVNPGLEKRVSGLMRISLCTVQRQEMANEILSAWKYLLPMNDDQRASSPLRILDNHIGEGLWRIVSCVDGLLVLNQDGWEGLASLLKWCSIRGGMLKPLQSSDIERRSPLPESDPAFQAYRSSHLMLSTPELDQRVPCSILETLRALIAAGHKRAYPQLSIASLDLLHTLHEKKINSLDCQTLSETQVEEFWKGCWRETVLVMAEAAEMSGNTMVRQHALSMLTDLFMEKHESAVPVSEISRILGEVCVPLAGRCIMRLRMGKVETTQSTDALMIEFELCIGLTFKPLRHHLKAVLAEPDGHLTSIWKAVLLVLEDMCRESDATDSDGNSVVLPKKIRATMNQLANEHLQNSIAALISAGVLHRDSKSPGDISDLTWASIGRIGIPETAVEELRQKSGPSEVKD